MPRRTPPTAASLHRAAAAYLSRYGANTQRLRRVLERHAAGHPELAPEVARLVGEAVAAGHVDDAAWAASRARRLVARGVAPAVVRGRLRAEGVEAGPALEAVEGEPELVAARAYARKRRLGRWRPEGTDPQLPQELARMGRAGFSYAVARRVLTEGPPEDP